MLFHTKSGANRHPFSYFVVYVMVKLWDGQWAQSIYLISAKRMTCVRFVLYQNASIKPLENCHVLVLLTKPIWTWIKTWGELSRNHAVMFFFFTFLGGSGGGASNYTIKATFICLKRIREWSRHFGETSSIKRSSWPHSTFNWWFQWKQ